MFTSKLNFKIFTLKIHKNKIMKNFKIKIKIYK